MKQDNRAFLDGERQYFPFFRSWRDSLELLPPESRLRLLEAIIEFGLDGVEPEGLGDIEKLVWFQIRPIMQRSWEISTARSNASLSREEKSGGAPIGNQNAKKKEPLPF